MKTLKWIGIFTMTFELISGFGFSMDFKAKQPILITTAGQSADGLMVKLIAQKEGLQFTFSKFAQPDSLKNHASLILVAGGSTKGLGAAKIDMQQETDRVKALIAAARKAQMNIITMHVGGKARRGKLSDEFNKLAADHADCLIVVENGNEDAFFSNIAKEKKIPIHLIEKIMGSGAVLKRIYTENKE